MMSFFDVNTAFFTIFSYPMSYLEFFGTVFNLWSVWLVARNNIWNWPVGLIGVILFGILFYQIQLYSDFIEQIYYLITTFYGWRLWGKQVNNNGNKLNISYNNPKTNLYYSIIILVLTVGFTVFISNIHLLLPNFFPVPASYPLLDSFTTITSFVAMILMSRKKIECWYLWILVDIIGIFLYFTKGVVFISLLYFIFLILASGGFYNWRKIYKKTKSI